MDININWNVFMIDNTIIAHRVFMIDNTIWLVVLTILKKKKVNGKDDIPYIKCKIKHV